MVPSPVQIAFSWQMPVAVLLDLMHIAYWCGCRAAWQNGSMHARGAAENAMAYSECACYRMHREEYCAYMSGSRNRLPMSGNQSTLDSVGRTADRRPQQHAFKGNPFNSSSL